MRDVKIVFRIITVENGLPIGFVERDHSRIDIIRVRHVKLRWTSRRMDYR